MLRLPFPPSRTRGVLRQYAGSRPTALATVSHAADPRGSYLTTPRVLERARDVLRLRHYSPRTECAYLGWMRRFVSAFRGRRPSTISSTEVTAYLSSLTTERRLSASTRNQARAALIFFFRDVLELPAVSPDGVPPAPRNRRPPLILSREEVRAILSTMRGTTALMASLLYGSGLRLMECAHLRIQDVDLTRLELAVRDRDTANYRVVPLPAALRGPLLRHVHQVHLQHENDLRADAGSVALPSSPGDRHPRSSTEWRWQRLFPATRHYLDPATRRLRRHHLHQSVVQNAVRAAVRNSGVGKPATCSTLRHSYAAHLLAAGHDVRTIQALLGHRDLSTTLIYANASPPASGPVRSPLDEA